MPVIIKPTLTLPIILLCSQCQQTITHQDLVQSNFLIILPSFIIQHQACPLVKTNPYPKCGFSYLKDITCNPK